MTDRPCPDCNGTIEPDRGPRAGRCVACHYRAQAAPEPVERTAVTGAPAVAHSAPSWDDVRLDDLDPGMPWQTAALCALGWPRALSPVQTDSETFFPEATCQRCPVQEPCLDLALRTGDGFGVYGGLSHAQRKTLPGYRPPSDWVKEHRASVVRARHAAGWTDEEIGYELGLATATINRIRRDNHIGHTPRSASA